MSRSDFLCHRCKKWRKRIWPIAGQDVCAFCVTPSERNPYPHWDLVAIREEQLLSEKRAKQARKNFGKEVAA
jgi:hypothetical protein